VNPKNLQQHIKRKMPKQRRPPDSTFTPRYSPISLTHPIVPFSAASSILPQQGKTAQQTTKSGGNRSLVGDLVFPKPAVLDG
jgi:hypothetical protein